jgi:hypothetical protein
MIELSGVVLNQNGINSGTEVLFGDFIYENFHLPADYKRAGVKSPQLTGFSICATVTDVACEFDWIVEYRDFLGAWQTLTQGTTTGAEIADSQVWIDSFFQDSISIEGFEDEFFRVGIKAISGITAWHYTTPNPLVGSYTSVRTTVSGALTDTAAHSFKFRLLAAVADEGTDFLGNQYRSLVVRTDASNIDTTLSNLSDAIWMSKPNPSAFAVESLYFDVRKTEQNDASAVIDRIVIDPITTDIFCNVYYASGDNPGTDADSWDDRVWTYSTTFKLRRKDTYVLPQPVSTDYIKLEFSHLQPRAYSAGDSAKPITYHKFPKWVLDYFLLQVPDAQFVSKLVQVTHDAYDLAFSYYADDLGQKPDLVPALDEAQRAQVEAFLADRSDLSDKVDSFTASQIDFTFDPYRQHPGIKGIFRTILGRRYQGDPTVGYPVETPPDAASVSQLVSSINRGSVVDELNHPAMFFYVPARHRYREVQAKLPFEKAYFAGVRSIAFMRDIFPTESDISIYNELLQDGANSENNDFLVSQALFDAVPTPPAPEPPATSGPNWSFEFPIDLDGNPSSPGWGPYPNDPWPTVNTPMEIAERTQDYSSDGDWSWHLKTPVGDGADLNECDVAAINPDTWTGDGDPFPNGWWPVVEGDEWTWQIDLQPIHNTTNNLYLEIDLFDVDGNEVDGNSTGSVSESFQTLTVTMTIPAGAVWAAPNIEVYPSLGEYVEFYVDNAVWERSPALLHRFAMLPVSDDASVILDPPAGTPVWTATGLPPGITLDPDTGIFEGYATAVDDYNTGVLTATVGADSVTRGLHWHITTAPFLKLAEFVDPNFSPTVEPCVAYVHANRCYLQGWLDYDPFDVRVLFDDTSVTQVNVLDKPLPLAYRPSVNTNVTLYTLNNQISDSDEVYDELSFNTQIRTDGTWVFTGPDYPTVDNLITFLLTDASWPVTPVTNVLSSPTGTPTDISSLLTVRGGGYWTADTPLTLERRDDLGLGDASIRVFTNGKIRWHGVPYYLGDSFNNSPLTIDGTWSATTFSPPTDHLKKATANNTGHGAGFDGATLKDGFAQLAGDFEITARVQFGGSGHAPGADSKWWGLGYSSTTGGTVTDSLVLLHDDSLGASSCLKLYRWQGGSSLTLLDTSGTYAGGTTTPSHTDFWYSMKRTSHDIIYSLYAADPKVVVGSPPTPLVTKTFTLTGAVDTALGPNNTIASPLYLMYFLSGDAVSTMRESRYRDSILGYDTQGPIGDYTGSSVPANPFGSTYRYYPPTQGYADAFPTKGLWLNVPIDGTGKNQVFSANIDGAIQVFESEDSWSFAIENDSGILIPSTQSYTPHTDSWFNPQVLTTPAPYDDGFHMGRRHLTEGFSKHAVDIHITEMDLNNAFATNTGKAGIIDRYDPVTGAYYALVYSALSSTSYQAEFWRIDPTAGTPATLLGSSTTRPTYNGLFGSSYGNHSNDSRIFLTTWLDTDPATGQRSVYWSATGVDYVNFSGYTVSISNELGKSAGGVGIDIVQGKVGKGKNAGCNIATNELNCDLRTWDASFRGFPRDGDVFNFNGLGWVAVDDRTTWKYVRADTANALRIPYGQPISVGTPVTPHAGTGPYTWTVDALPAGITMTSVSAGPTFSGTPTTLGVTNSQITVRDVNGSTDTRDQFWVVWWDVEAPVVATIPSGSPYSHQITYSPLGVGSPIFSVGVPYFLPPGLTLSSSGLISGTPTNPASYPAVQIVMTGTIDGKTFQNWDFYIQLTVT